MDKQALINDLSKAWYENQQEKFREPELCTIDPYAIACWFYDYYNNQLAIRKQELSLEEKLIHAEMNAEGWKFSYMQLKSKVDRISKELLNTGQGVQECDATAVK